MSSAQRVSLASHDKHLAQPLMQQRAACIVTRLFHCAGATTAPPMTPAITLTDDALKHLHKLRAESGGEALLLRIGVKSGGCSGMSYHMDFEAASNVRTLQ